MLDWSLLCRKASLYVYVLCIHYDFFFFFQAEDGIRDIGVTGVQTCALPISSTATRTPRPRGGRRRSSLRRSAGRTGRARSEERRVGKECRSRWSPDH